jgi:hypothetical protein
MRKAAALTPRMGFIKAGPDPAAFLYVLRPKHAARFRGGSGGSSTTFTFSSTERRGKFDKVKIILCRHTQAEI